MSKPTPTAYTFRDAHGQAIEIPGSATIEDLVALGVTRLSFKRPDEPLGPDEWREAGERATFTKSRRKMTRRG